MGFIIVSGYMNVGIYDITKVEKVPYGIHIKPSPEVARFEIEGETGSEFVRDYLNAFNRIISPGVALLSEFYRIISDEVISIKSIKFGSREIPVSETNVLLNLYANGVLEITFILKIQEKDKEIKELLENYQPETLLFDVLLNIEKITDEEIKKRFLSMPKEKQNIWYLFQTIAFIIMTEYLGKKAEETTKIKELLKTPIIYCYFFFIFPKEVIPWGPVPEGEIQVKWETFYTETPQTVNELFDYIFSFDLLTYTKASLNFILDMLQNPLKYFGRVEELTMVMEQISKFRNNINSLGIIRSVFQNTRLINLIEKGIIALRINILMQDIKFNLDILERKLSIITSESNEKSLLIFNALLGGSISTGLAGVISEYMNYSLAQYLEITFLLWVIFSSLALGVQSIFHETFYKKMLQSSFYPQTKSSSK